MVARLARYQLAVAAKARRHVLGPDPDPSHTRTHPSQEPLPTRLHDIAEKVLLPCSGPLVGRLAHGRGRGDGVDE